MGKSTAFTLSPSFLACNTEKLGVRLKASSQSDATPCIALIRETHKFVTEKVGGFLTTRRKNATRGNARIGSKSILMSCCFLRASMQIRHNATHCLASYCEPALRAMISKDVCCFDM